jgi:hypothetical protein
VRRIVAYAIRERHAKSLAGGITRRTFQTPGAGAGAGSETFELVESLHSRLECGSGIDRDNRLVTTSRLEAS